MKTIQGLKDVLRGAALLSAAVLLASCGGESDNLSSGSVGTVSNCSSIPGASCVKGRLIDDAVANVNYECGLNDLGTVRSVTGIDGEFTCPNGSRVTFSLLHPEKKNVKLVLGSVMVTRPADIYSNSSPGYAIPVYFYVTTRDLAGDTETVYSPATINIARLLHTLSTDTTSPDLPSYRVIISEDDKRKLTAEDVASINFRLPYETIDPLNPGPGTFDASVRSFLQSFTPDKQLISVNTASKRVSRGIFSTLAGVYESYDPSSIALGTRGGMVGAGSGYFVGAMWNLVDRKGRAQAAGIYSFIDGGVTGAEDTLLWTDPKPFTLDNATWPVDAGLSSLTYSLRNDDGTSNGQVIDITQGNIKREVVAGSVPIYQALFGESPDAETDLGRWRLIENNTNVLVESGRMTLARVAPVASVLDPDLWSDSNLTFPLPITVTFRNSDTTSCAPLGCVVGTLRMVVLSDGNIISDMSEKCGVDINQDTLNYPSGGSEVSLGAVARILDSATDQTGGTLETMTLLTMIPDLPYFRSISPYLPYAQFGSNFGEASLLRVDEGTNYLRMYGVCSKSNLDKNLCTVKDALAPDLATWGNRYTTMKFLKLGNSADTSNPLYLNSSGTLSSVQTPSASCVTPP